MILDSSGQPMGGPEQRIVPIRARDGLANALTGAGTTVDKRIHAAYFMIPLSPQQIEAAYRSSWLMRKCVDRPVSDMIREGRDWQAQKEQIAAIEKEEERLGLWAKLERALTLGRLGGGALILGVPGSDPMMPINPRAAGKDGLKYIHVVSRYQLQLGEQITDPMSEYYGNPSYFQMSGTGGQQVKLHPSRVVAFKGLPVPDMGIASRDHWFWGDSLIQAIHDAVKNADSAQGSIASLIEEAKVDWFGFKGLNDMVASVEGENRVMRRLEIMQAAKSNHRAAIGDVEDEWDQRQISWTGMPEVIQTYLSIVAGAADIPATILLGKSPDGMNSTGDSDFRAYYDSINSKQKKDLQPQIKQVDQLLVPSALGSFPDEVSFKWAPLWKMDEKDASTVFKTKCEGVKILADTGLIPDQALSETIVNVFTEDGSLPGLDAAVDAATDIQEPTAAEIAAEMAAQAAGPPATPKQESPTQPPTP